MRANRPCTQQVNTSCLNILGYARHATHMIYTYRHRDCPGCSHRVRDLCCLSGSSLSYTVRSVLFVRQFRSRMGPRKRGFDELISGCQCSHFVAIRFGKISLSMLFCLCHGADQFYSFIISSSCVSGTHPGQSLSRNSKYDLPPSILKWCCSISCVHISNDIPG